MDRYQAPIKKYVLVAEDDKFYSKIYKVKLSKEGIDVEVVGNGDELIQAAKKRKPDLILLDLIMPVKDGFAALSELKADPNLKDIKIVVLSNLGQQEDVEKAKALGADNYLIKSDISVTDMVNKVKSYLT